MATTNSLREKNKLHTGTEQRPKSLDIEIGRNIVDYCDIKEKPKLNLCGLPEALFKNDGKDLADDQEISEFQVDRGLRQVADSENEEIESLLAKPMNSICKKKDQPHTNLKVHLTKQVSKGSPNMRLPPNKNETHGRSTVRLGSQNRLEGDELSIEVERNSFTPDGISEREKSSQPCIQETKTVGEADDQEINGFQVDERLGQVTDSENEENKTLLPKPNNSIDKEKHHVNTNPKPHSTERVSKGSPNRRLAPNENEKHGGSTVRLGSQNRLEGGEVSIEVERNTVTPNDIPEREQGSQPCKQETKTVDEADDQEINEFQADEGLGQVVDLENEENKYLLPKPNNSIVKGKEHSDTNPKLHSTKPVSKGSPNMRLAANENERYDRISVRFGGQNRLEGGEVTIEVESNANTIQKIEQSSQQGIQGTDPLPERRPKRNSKRCNYIYTALIVTCLIVLGLGFTALLKVLAGDQQNFDNVTSHPQTEIADLRINWGITDTFKEKVSWKETNSTFLKIGEKGQLIYFVKNGTYSIHLALNIDSGRVASKTETSNTRYSSSICIQSSRKEKEWCISMTLPPKTAIPVSIEADEMFVEGESIWIRVDRFDHVIRGNSFNYMTIKKN